MLGQRARPVRRAVAGKPTLETVHGVPPPTQHLPLPAEAASALFQVVSQRYLKTSIVITTNRGVGAWGEILGDTTVAAAMLDRLLHRSVVINLDGESYRLRDHHAAAETPRRTTTGTRQQLHWPLLTGENFRRAHLGTFDERDHHREAAACSVLF